MSPARTSSPRAEIHQDQYFLTGAGKDYGDILGQCRAELIRIGMTEQEFAELPGSVPLTMMPIERLRSVLEWTQPQKTAETKDQFLAVFGDEVETKGKQMSETRSFTAADKVEPNYEPGSYPGKLEAINDMEWDKPSPFDNKVHDYVEFVFDIGGEYPVKKGFIRVDYDKLSPKATLRKYAEALLGHKLADGEGFGFSDLLGKSVIIKVGVNDDGYNTVEEVIPALTAAPRSRPAPMKVETEETEEVPF